VSETYKFLCGRAQRLYLYIISIYELYYLCPLKKYITRDKVRQFKPFWISVGGFTCYHRSLYWPNITENTELLNHCPESVMWWKPCYRTVRSSKREAL